MTGSHVLRRLALLAVAVLLAAPAWAQPEEILDTPAGWTYWYGTTSATIAADINAGLRPFSIQRVAANSYDVVTVANSGDYAVAGFGTGNMHYDRTLAQMTTALANRRLVSLDCYEVAGQTQMSGISIPNPGGAVGWGWLVGQTRQQIVDWVSNTTPALRITDLSIYTVGGQKYYAAVAVNNQGAQYQGWWWYFDQTGEEIVDLLTANSARLIDIELETAPTLFSPARFACVMVAQNPGAGWFHDALTAQQVNDFINQTGGRLTSLHRYTTALGATRYAVSLVDNANDQTRRVRDYMAAEATAGTYGFKLKRVGGEVLASLNENFVFEPASSMKIIHGAYAIRECAQGDMALDDDIWVPNRCTSEYYNNVCPDDLYSCDSGYEPFSTTIRGMLQNSHNGRTHTLELLFGRATLNNFADFTLDLTNTQINHTLGCLCGEPFNTTTASDLVSVYEQIGDGTLFNSTWRDNLFSLMANVQAWGYGSAPGHSFYTLGQVINQEAAPTDLTPAEITAFRDEVQYVVKGGAYGCDGTTWRASAGWSRLPFKLFVFGNWFTIPRDYAFTTFVDGGTDPGSQVAYPASEEILREQIAEALATWDDACVPGISSQPANTTVEEGLDAHFTVVAGGTGSPTYQWQRFFFGSWLNMTDAAGQVSGATTATLNILGVAEANEGQYRCRITKICGTSTSNAATLTVIPGDLTPVPDGLPDHLVMHSPSPNPFNPMVTLRFSVPRQTDLATLELFDVAGRRVRTMSASSLPAGPHEFTWNGTDDGGRRVSSGTYLARLRAGGEVAMHRVVMVE
jgi:hypothetical protein